MTANKSLTQYERMTGTPIEKLIIRLSIPTILTMLITNIYNMADTAFVGRLGTSASGAVGIVFGFMSILQAIGFLFGQGAGSLTSRLLGAKDRDAADRIASSGIFYALFFSTLTSIICYLNLDRLVYALGSTSTIAPYARTYVIYILAAAPFIVTSFTMNNLLRFEGKPALGMIGMMTGAVLNIVGDPILMFGFGLGIHGAGLSTALSQFISFSILLSMFLRGKTTVRISIRKVTTKWTDFREIVGIGLPSLLRQGLNSIATVILNTHASVYGDAAVAAMAIVSRIVFFVFAVALGIGQGFQPVAAFNYGAQKYDRVRKAYRFTILLAQITMILMMIPVLIESGSLIRLFRDDPDVIRIGTRALRLSVSAQICLPFCMASEMLVQSTGKKLWATILTCMRNGLLFIPSIMILSRIRGLSGIQEAQPAAFVLSLIPSAIIAWLFFKSLAQEETAALPKRD